MFKIYERVFLQCSKCVKDCGDPRKISFIGTGLLFVSEMFIIDAGKTQTHRNRANTHTNTNTHTIKHIHTQTHTNKHKHTKT